MISNVETLETFPSFLRDTALGDILIKYSSTDAKYIKTKLFEMKGPENFIFPLTSIDRKSPDKFLVLKKVSDPEKRRGKGITRDRNILIVDQESGAITKFDKNLRTNGFIIMLRNNVFVYLSPDNPNQMRFITFDLQKGEIVTLSELNFTENVYEFHRLSDTRLLVVFSDKYGFTDDHIAIYSDKGNLNFQISDERPISCNFFSLLDDDRFICSERSAEKVKHIIREVTKRGMLTNFGALETNVDSRAYSIGYSFFIIAKKESLDVYQIKRNKFKLLQKIKVENEATTFVKISNFMFLLSNKTDPLKCYVYKYSVRDGIFVKMQEIDSEGWNTYCLQVPRDQIDHIKTKLMSISTLGGDLAEIIAKYV